MDQFFFSLLHNDAQLQRHNAHFRRLILVLFFFLLKVPQTPDHFPPPLPRCTISKAQGKGRSKYFPVQGLESSQCISFYGLLKNPTVMQYDFFIPSCCLSFHLIPFWSFTITAHSVTSRPKQTTHACVCLAGGTRMSETEKFRKRAFF